MLGARYGRHCRGHQVSTPPRDNLICASGQEEVPGDCTVHDTIQDGMTYEKQSSSHENATCEGVPTPITMGTTKVAGFPESVMFREIDAERVDDVPSVPPLHLNQPSEPCQPRKFNDSC